MEIKPLDIDIPFLWGVFTTSSLLPHQSLKGIIDQINQVTIEYIPGFVAHDPGRAKIVAAATYGREKADTHE